MKISVYSDGQQQYGIKRLTADVANELCVRAYNTLFSLVEPKRYLKTKVMDWTEPLFRKDICAICIPSDARSL